MTEPRQCLQSFSANRRENDYGNSTMRTVCVVLLVLFLDSTSSGHEEKDFQCPHTGVPVPSTSVCDGLLDCILPSGASSVDDLSDESTEICAPTPFLDNEILLQSRDVTSTSAQLSWSKATTRVSNHSLKLAGYFVTGKSEPHAFHNTISGRLHSYQAQWLKPWTHYALILRPFYTESGKPQASYKIGRAASVNVLTLSSEPEAPGLVSVLSAQQRNVVLNIVGPPTWNSDPVGFHVRWEAISDRRGPNGELSVPLPADWSPVENTLNVTIPLPGGHDYRIFVSARGADSSSGDRSGPAIDVDVSVPLDSYEISAHVVDSRKAVISWRASELVELFKLTVYTYSDGYLRFHRSWKFEGTNKMSSRCTVPINDLQPWMHYMASLEGCSGEICSAAVNTTFITPPTYLSSPSVTRVEATSNSSFELAWDFSQHDNRLYHGFRVKYCPSNIASCPVLDTTDKNLIVHGLNPGTTVNIYVRAQFRSSDGRLRLGNVAAASVTTWNDIPDLEVTYETNVQDEVGTCLLRWVCVNSSVDYIQV
ncbi:uncharacterized protein LOC119448983 [Dermacentor silvarum]|uniref:uncharacterized protein LOC119448983 n=1 Tax=Dermacentor silvarum TaxID=543639 RepID=UPI002100C56F|nr:uncharacterized protein LOC119448983 [Dermacentor silvarum]